MFAVAALAILVAMLLTLARLFMGPSLYDRTLAVNAFGTKTVLLIGVLGFLNGRPDFLDIALIYALINFIGTIAILKFFRYRALGDFVEIPSEADRPEARQPGEGG
jgi:multicomponent Na+:H+ antiporter subunit F